MLGVLGHERVGWEGELCHGAGGGHGQKSERLELHGCGKVYYNAIAMG
jgi:hypothetical protein